MSKLSQETSQRGHVMCLPNYILSLKNWESNIRIRTWMITEVVEKPSVTSYFFCSFLQKPGILSKPCLTSSCLSICPHSSKTSMVNWLALPSDSKQTLRSKYHTTVLENHKYLILPIKMWCCVQVHYILLHTTALHVLLLFIEPRSGLRLVAECYWYGWGSTLKSSITKGKTK